MTNAWHAKSGGIRTFYRALLRAAEHRQHLLSLVVPGEQDDVEQAGDYGRIYYVKAAPAPLDHEYRMIHPPSYLFPGSRIPAILKEERPDLVEVNDKYTLMYLAGMLRLRLVNGIDWRPTVVGLSCERLDQNLRFYLLDRQAAHLGRVSCRGASPRSFRESLSGRFAQLYMKWLYFPMFDHHITVSEHTAAELRAAARGHKIRRGVWVMPMGVELEAFSAARRTPVARRWLTNFARSSSAFAAPKESALPEDVFYLLYVGRLAPEKNLGLLLKLMSRLKNSPDRTFHLLVAGAGPRRNWFEVEAQTAAPGQVHFLGHIDDRSSLANLYANADAFVHPNPDEPFGIALLEAMASGLPLVAPDQGGVTQYANEQNAWSVPATEDAFEAAVRQIASDPARTRLRAQRALETAARYGWDQVADSFLELYEAIHRLQTGADKQPAIQPLFYSTPGDYWGREKQPEPKHDAALARG